jgi:hypothetical protein
MLLLPKKTCLAFLIFSFCSRGEGQQLASDTGISRPLKNALSVYHRALYPETGLYNGIEYLPYFFPFVEDQPFFLSDRPLTGSVVYKNILYENVKLMYDVTRQQLVVIHPFHLQKIRLTTAHVNAFNLADHQFENLTSDSLSKGTITTGYYEVLYKGKNVRLLSSIKKDITEELTSTYGVLYHLKDNNHFFIEKDGRYYALSNQRSVLNIFSDRKKEMIPFVTKNKPERRRNNEEVYKLIAKFYDELRSR